MAIKVMNVFSCVNQKRKFADKLTPLIIYTLYSLVRLDSISWPFILEVLRARGFGEWWCVWIIAIFSSTSSNVSVNGHATERVWHIRGLH